MDSPNRSPHLYVMQSSIGLIKVGRSSDPQKRRRALEGAGGSHIRLVAVVEGEGERERELHGLLHAHRRKGEWFAGTGAVMRILSDALGRPLTFPFGDAGVLRKGRDAAKKKAAKDRADREIARVVADIMKGSSAADWSGLREQNRCSWEDERWTGFDEHWDRYMAPYVPAS